MLAAIFRRWRQWDWIAAQRVDRYITNSRTTQARIRELLDRDSIVVYPPVETSRFSPGEVGQHYLVLSELMPHKRIDVADPGLQQARACRSWSCGDGPDARRLRRIAGPDDPVRRPRERRRGGAPAPGCRALVVTAVEEFGIAAVEAQAAGRPVIAVRGGGTLETVVDGVTGCFWTGGADELAAAVAGFDDAAVDPADCVRNAARFDTSVFKRELPRQVESALDVEDAPQPRRPRPVLRTARLARRAGL